MGNSIGFRSSDDPVEEIDDGIESSSEEEEETQDEVVVIEKKEIDVIRYKLVEVARKIETVFNEI